MPATTIDRHVLRRLVLHRLAEELGEGTDAGYLVQLPGDPPPEDNPGVWLRLVELSKQDVQRRQPIRPALAGEVAHDSASADVFFSVDVHVAASRTEEDRGALDTAISRIERALQFTTLRDDASGHTLTIREASSQEDPDDDPRGERSGVLGFAASATRRGVVAAPGGDGPLDGLHTPS